MEFCRLSRKAAKVLGSEFFEHGFWIIRGKTLEGGFGTGGERVRIMRGDGLTGDV